MALGPGAPRFDHAFSGVRSMKRVVLTSLSGLELMYSGRADIVIPFAFRFVGGPLPSPDKLASYVAARSEKHDRGSHWSDFVSRWHGHDEDSRALGLAEFRQQYETIELWFDPNPNDQLHLISRYNPIDRWWGGTRLTNDFLWRWNPALVAPQPSRPLLSFQTGPTTYPSRSPL
jgi:hypothetical protein